MTKPDYKQIYQQYPQIDFEDIKYLFHNDYYDGAALCGLAILNDQKVWFLSFDQYKWTEEDMSRTDEEWEPPWYRRYVVLQLQPEEVAQLETTHSLFQKYVGTHTDYPREGKVKSRGEMDLFYKRDKSKELQVDFDNAKILGWYELV